MRIWFDLYSLYYWPQYEPVYNELISRGHECRIVAYRGDLKDDLLEAFFTNQGKHLPVDFIKEKDALSYYQEKSPDWIIFGNGSFTETTALNKNTKTALLYHGIGVKSCYYSETLSIYDIRFTEGHFRQLQLANMFPSVSFSEVGFAKLDPLFNDQLTNSVNLESLGLDSSKQTLLYAPTFYPSSIERMPKHWPEIFSDLNIIIKPHFFSLSKPQYSRQQKLFKQWANYKNVYLAPATSLSLLPYMEIADVLLSEASSALFEFSALNKPVIWLDFLQLRWGYRGPLKFRLRNRMDTTIDPYRDIALHVPAPKHLEKSVRGQLANPMQYMQARQRATVELIGKTDGKVSVRIADSLERFMGPSV